MEATFRSWVCAENWIRMLKPADADGSCLSGSYLSGSDADKVCLGDAMFLNLVTRLKGVQFDLNRGSFDDILIYPFFVTYIYIFIFSKKKQESI